MKYVVEIHVDPGDYDWFEEVCQLMDIGAAHQNGQFIATEIVESDEPPYSRVQVISHKLVQAGFNLPTKTIVESHA